MSTTQKFEPADPKLIETFIARAKEADKHPGLPMFEIMGREGDTKYMWDPNLPDEVEGARRQFDYFVKEKKYAAFAVLNDKGDKGEQIRTFDPKAGRIIFCPAMAGG